MSTCVISFSSRKNGNCAKIGEYICSQLPDAKLYSFADFEIHPCGKCNCECFVQNDKCPWIKDKEYKLLDEITKSSLTYFIIPNYCDYPCANFFIFNERSQCYFQGRENLLEKYERVPKKAVVVSNTNEEHFKAALAYQSGGEIPALFLPAKKYGKSSIAGDLITSGKVVADLTAFITETA